MVEFKFRVRAPGGGLVAVGPPSNLEFQRGQRTVYPFSGRGFYQVPPDGWRLQAAHNKQASEGFLADGGWLSEVAVPPL